MKKHREFAKRFLLTLLRNVTQALMNSRKFWDFMRENDMMDAR